MAMAALFLCNPPQTSTSTNECTNRSTSRNRCHLREIAFSLNSYEHPLDLAFPCRNPRYSRLCYTPVSSPPVRPHRTKWSYLRLSRQNTRDIDLRQCALHAKWPVNHHRLVRLNLFLSVWMLLQVRKRNIGCTYVRWINAACWKCSEAL